MTKLSDPQRIVLSSAAKRKRGLTVERVKDEGQGLRPRRDS